MAFTLTWRFKCWQDTTTSIDLTSYVLHASISSSAELGFAGRSTATIVLNNNSGIFTPNGTGTYASTDWFKYAFEISSQAAGGSEIDAFSGMVDDMQIDMVSIKQSTVTFTLVDMLTIAGRSQSTTDYSTVILFTYLDQAIRLMINGYSASGTTYYAGTDLPYLNTAYESVIATSAYTAMNTGVTNDDFPAGRIGDWINNNLLITAPGTAFAVGLEVRTDEGIAGFRWRIGCIDYTLNRTSLAKTFAFVDGSTSTTSGQIPLLDIAVRYEFDKVINNTTARDQRSFYTATTVSNTVSAAKYGTRAVAFNSTCKEAQTDVDRVANFFTNRYADVRYMVTSVTTSMSAIKSRAVDDNVAVQNFSQLISQSYGLWNRAAVSYTAPGVSSRRTDQLVITKLLVEISPADTVATVEFVYGADNQSFELDSSTYGVLDTNKVG